MINNTVRFALLCCAALNVSAEAPKGYYRSPAIHDNTIVFTAEGDLWRVSTAGGVAQRLTSHPGVESYAAFSPDGQTLAFSAEYEGPTEVYTMPLAGGLPKRITYDGSFSRVVGWTPDGRIMYSTETLSTLPNYQLVVVDPKSGKREVLPLAQASAGTYEPTGKTLYFVRLSKQGSSTKRYKGGWIENVWRFSEGDAEAVELAPDFAGTSRNPMWWNGKLYFASDRDGVMNLWSMKPDGSGLTQLTKHSDYDIKSPSAHNGKIVYQHGADLRLFDIASGKDSLLDIRLLSDFDQERERWVKKPLDFLTSSHVSPNGDRVALTVRGQVFVAPVDQGRLVEIPRKQGIRYRNAQFMPDGKSLVVSSDESGEVEFWKSPANGVGAAEHWTTNGTVFRFPAVNSPDGKYLVWSDKDLKCWLYEIESRKTTLIGQSTQASVQNGFDGFDWSPDSQWLAYVDAGPNEVRRVFLYHVADGQTTAVTSDRLESYNPAWSPDGKWLYFLSDREFRSMVASPWGPRAPEPYFTETTKIYALALTKGLTWPFKPRDELHPAKEEENKDKKPEKKQEPDKPKEGDDKTAKTDAKPEAKPADKSEKSEKPVVVKVDLEGLPARLYEVPVPAGNYSGLNVAAKHLIWIARDTGFSGHSHLNQLEITDKDPKPKTLVDELGSYEITADHKKLMLRKGENLYVIPADSGAPAKLEEKANLDNWMFSIIPREEWRQIFTESWRMMRDYYYDRGMQGVDWPAMRLKYLPLVDRVSERSELSDVIYEMVGELSTLHVTVRFGDQRESPDQVRISTLGARLSRDDNAGGWRVDHIYRTDPDFPGQAGPLARPGVDVSQGDIITRINGIETLSVPHPGELLRNQADKQVLLELKPASGGDPRQTITKPVSAEREADLRYDEWELTRREHVEELGHGSIGYVHLRAMTSDDIAQWARNFFPVFNRQGLIIDVRNNRGGNIDSWILEKLLRRAWFYWQPRVGSPYWNMQYAFRGHMVVICNERTGSDGEAFTEGFKRLGLGKVIGMRTWGGEIWLSAQRWLVDSGMASAAEFGVYGPEGAWLIEGHGVDPDIVVDNLPHATFNGSDAQLEAAVKHLQGLIANDPRPVPAPPKYPDKSFKP